MSTHGYDVIARDGPIAAGVGGPGDYAAGEASFLDAFSGEWRLVS